MVFLSAPYLVTNTATVTFRGNFARWDIQLLLQLAQSHKKLMRPNAALWRAVGRSSYVPIPMDLSTLILPNTYPAICDL